VSLYSPFEDTRHHDGVIRRSAHQVSMWVNNDLRIILEAALALASGPGEWCLHPCSIKEHMCEVAAVSTNAGHSLALM
jgi:hypothetical protein